MLNNDRDKSRLALANRLKEVIENSSYSKAALARACDVSPQALTGWLNTGRIAKESLAAIANKLKVDLDWLITGDGLPNKPKSLTVENNVLAAPNLGGLAPLISWVQAGSFTESHVEITDDMDFYPRPAGSSENTFVLKVVGESMIDEYKPGTLIFVDPERAAVSGDDVIAVMIDTGEATLKRYIEEPGMGKMLKSLNSNWPDPYLPINGNCHITGVVVAAMWLK